MAIVCEFLVPCNGSLLLFCMCRNLASIAHLVLVRRSIPNSHSFIERTCRKELAIGRVLNGVDGSLMALEIVLQVEESSIRL